MTPTFDGLSIRECCSATIQVLITSLAALLMWPHACVNSSNWRASASTARSQMWKAVPMYCQDLKQGSSFMSRTRRTSRATQAQHQWAEVVGFDCCRAVTAGTLAVNSVSAALHVLAKRVHRDPHIAATSCSRSPFAENSACWTSGSQRAAAACTTAADQQLTRADMSCRPPHQGLLR
jgi:hypothetical protein